MAPILLLEINEVPWRVIDRYAPLLEFPHIRQFFERSHQFTTVAVDHGELSPWVTWPTFHRGMNNEAHGIKNLGQDPATFQGKPIWQEIREQGGTIGICGSLQSWPPIEPGEGGFYLPDTFAHDESCFPPALNPIQAFNLSQVRKNARVVSGALPGVKEVLTLASSFLRSGISIRTCSRIACQLLGERVNLDLLGRRPIFQTILFWDVFRKHFNPCHPPRFSTFFTNHIAGVMHRYWCDIFPEDFPEHTGAPKKSREPLMRFALRVLDDMLAEALKWAKANPDLVIIFASSMGQAAVHRGDHEGVELVVEDLALLMSRTGIARQDYNPLLAMAPQVAVEIPNTGKRARVRSVLDDAYCGDRRHFILAQEIGSSLSITVSTPALKDMSSNMFVMDGRSVAWSDAGIRKQAVEPGTAYHVPEGSLAVYCETQTGQRLNQGRTRVDADHIKDWMLAVSRGGHNNITSLVTASA